MRISMIVPTFDRTSIVFELLQETVSMYAKYDIDIYIYDSNASDDTYLVVKNFMILYKNVFYRRLSSKIESNEKIYVAWQDFESNTNYDYVWLCGDALRCSESYLKLIIPYLTQNFDILLLTAPNTPSSLFYENKLKLFKDWAWIMTGYGSVIINRRTMLSNCNWEYLSNKYLNNTTLYYSQIGFYFERINSFDEFNAVCIGTDSKDARLYESRLKKGTGWKDKTIDVICNSWINTVNELPSEYNVYKKHVIKSLGVIVLSKKYLWMLKKDNIYNAFCFFRYFKKWHLLCDFSYLFLLFVALLPKSFAAFFCFPFFRICIDHHKEIKRLINNLKSCSNIYLYGAGTYGKRFLDLLKTHHIKVSGFIVSHKDAETAYGYPVYDVDTVSFSENSVVVLALKNDHDNIIKELSKKISRKQIIEPNITADYWQIMEAFQSKK